MKRRISVYRIVRDRSFQGLAPKNKEEFDRQRSQSWLFDATRECHRNWSELEMLPSGSSLQQPDIWEIVPGAFALEDHAYEELYSSVEETQPSVQYVKCAGRRLAVINSTLCIDCLVSGCGEFDTGDPSRDARYEFDGSQLAVSLFKIPETRHSELLTLDGFDREKDFKTLVELFGFTGVEFEWLWSGDSFMEQ